MGIASERVLQESGELRVSVRDIGCSVRLRPRRVAECRDDIAEREKTAINRDAFLDALTSGGRAFQLKKC